MPIEGEVDSASSPGPSSRWLLTAQAVAAACLVTAFAVQAPHDHWNLLMLAVLGAVAVTSDLIGVKSELKVQISGASLAIVLAAVLLGGTPAALVGMVTMLVGWLRWREAGHYLRNNLLAFGAFPLVVGTAFHMAVTAIGTSDHRTAFYALVVPAYLIAVVLNFFLVVGYQCILDHRSVLVEARRMLQLIVTSEMVCAVLTVGIAWLAVTVGIVGLALVAIALVAYQHVVGQLVVSRERGEQLRRQAVTDELTGLPNRTGFIEHAERVLADARARESRAGVMLMDLNGFKEVNDTLGHHMGDELLSGIGSRIDEVAKRCGFAARLSGDEFAVVVIDNPDQRRLLSLAQRLTTALERPFDVGELSLEISASIGIAQFPRDGEDVHTLLQRADVAMYLAKDDGTHIELYQRERDRHSTKRLALTADLRAGIAAGQIHLHYHPQVEIASNTLIGVEALARWDHPALGPIAPIEFIELAEQTGLIRPLTERALDLALEQVQTWQRSGLDTRVAVNLSARLLSDRRLPDQVISQLNNAGVSPDRIALEITETMMLRDRARALATLTRLHELGIALSVDDFGTGYSSLAYLRELPLDEIKVDRSFVSGMTGDATDAVIVRSTVELGRSLALRTVAEGVEDVETLMRLQHLRCVVAQGFHYTQPLPGQALLEWARSHEQKTLTRVVA
jgi:diguanylate cyclase (GGDEF)-like protein